MSDASKFQNIKAPYVTLVKQAIEPATPDAGTERVYIDDADGLLKKIDESDVVTLIGGAPLVSDKKVLTSGDKTTTSTSFVDVDAAGLDITLTTGARKCEITVNAVGKNNNTSQTQLDVAIDGTRQGQTFGLAFSGGVADVNFNLSFTYVTDVLSAGSHTFKLKWRVDGNTGTLYASTSVAALIFAVKELPHE